MGTTGASQVSVGESRKDESRSSFSLVIISDLRFVQYCDNVG